MLKAALSPEIFISENCKEEGTTLGGETVSTDPAVIPLLSVFKAQSSERKGSLFLCKPWKAATLEALQKPICSFSSTHLLLHCLYYTCTHAPSQYPDVPSGGRRGAYFSPSCIRSMKFCQSFGKYTCLPSYPDRYQFHLGVLSTAEAVLVD